MLKKNIKNRQNSIRASEKRQKPRQEFGKSGKSKKVAMVLTEVGSFAQQIKTYRLNS